nr:hypothetical protein [Tanacetum cinerariifolium]
MRDEHLDTISETESDEFIKSSVENLVPSPSESEDLSDSECDVPSCDDFTTFLNLLFNADDDFSSSDDESFSDENISKKINSNPLDGKLVTYCGCEGLLNGGFSSFCLSRAGNSFAYDPNLISFDDSQNLFDYPPQPQYQTYSYFQIISEELEEYINSLSWNYPTFYDDDDKYTIQYREYLDNSSNAITPDLPTKEPDNYLSMGDEHLSTFRETKSDEVIKSSVENLVPIPSDFSNFNDDCTSSDEDSFEDINYVEASPPDSELVRLKVSPSLFPIPVEDSDSFFEKSITSLSYSDNSLPEFETFSNHTKETSSSSTTTHVDNSLPEYDLFLFKIEPD